MRGAETFCRMAAQPVARPSSTGGNRRHGASEASQERRYTGRSSEYLNKAQQRIFASVAVRLVHATVVVDQHPIQRPLLVYSHPWLWAEERSEQSHVIAQGGCGSRRQRRDAAPRRGRRRICVTFRPPPKATRLVHVPVVVDPSLPGPPPGVNRQ